MVQVCPNETSSQDELDQLFMRAALRQAEAARDLGEVPVGAVITREGKILAAGYNRREGANDPLAHAEILTIEAAAKIVGHWRLIGCTMYVTLEPCAMCAGALVNSRIERLVFGARDPKAGFCGSLGNLVQDPRLNHRLELCVGVLETECSGLLKSFFAGLRGRKARPDL